MPTYLPGVDVYKRQGHCREHTFGNGDGNILQVVQAGVSNLKAFLPGQGRRIRPYASAE